MITKSFLSCCFPVLPPVHGLLSRHLCKCSGPLPIPSGKCLFRDSVHLELLFSLLFPMPMCTVSIG